MASELVYRKTKKGTKTVYNSQFKTRIGAMRAANAELKKRGAGWIAGDPIWQGSYYTIRVIKLRK